MYKRRPTGITFLAIVYLVLGLFSLLWSGLVFGIGGLSAATGWLFGQEAIQSMGGASLWSGLLGLISAVVQIVTAIGLLRMKRWAWVLALISAGLTLLQGLMGLFSGGLFGFLCGALWLIVPAAIFFYLLKPSVRAAFTEKAPPTVEELPSQKRPLPPELPLEEVPASKTALDAGMEPPLQDPLDTWPPPKTPDV